ncbi:MAG: phosphate acetyltransferase [Candidatus Omnitrophica bacterium]|nr:phosphate acetyltransferase [Candidatus Omnitrophota bacterium]
MLRVISELRERAKHSRRRICLPEGEDERTLQALHYIVREKLADITLLGDKGKIASICKAKGFALGNTEIIDPAASDKLDVYTDGLYGKRKNKDMTRDDVRAMLVQKPVYFAAMLVGEKKADGFVAGAVHTTRDVARSALWCIGVNPEVKTMSSSFIMVLQDESFGEGGVLVFADCGIVPEPSPRQLANIAMSAARLMQNIFNVQPRIAVLSFSTKGSGKTEATENLVRAVEITREKYPNLLIDGELQADAALVPDIAKRKAPDSPVGGKANVLIFPNLESGNIAYKLTERLAKARALGPLLHGVMAPCSDLSRGCSADDIIDIVCVTSLRCAHT